MSKTTRNAATRLTHKVFRLIKNIVSSGEAAINSIKNFNYGKYFFHLGPERDGTIYAGLENFKTDLKTSHPHKLILFVVLIVVDTS